ncbi:MAG: hypothetical protein JXA10_00945 [Anaerolineae bacterium]|nr:hypothetical protein [Anaerolineae bacterium]
MSSNPPSLAYDLARDVKILSAMASNLTPYLYESELYGYLAGDLPRLTVGGVLLRLYRLLRLDDEFLTSEQQSQIQDANLNFEAECSQWAVHYEHKLQHELQARCHALEQFLHECAEKLHGCAAIYPSQAEKRTMIYHLQAEAHERDVLADDMLARITKLDQRLRQFFEEGDFLIGDERLASVYPKDTFWWLYGQLIEEKR